MAGVCVTRTKLGNLEVRLLPSTSWSSCTAVRLKELQSSVFKHCFVLCCLVLLITNTTDFHIRNVFSIQCVCVYMHVLGELVHKVQGCRVSGKSPPAAPLAFLSSCLWHTEGWGLEISICFPHTVIITTVNFVLPLSCQWSILAVVTGLPGLVVMAECH